MKSPNFLVIGPAKTATSWLMKALGEHPEVYMYQQEIRYFSNNYNKGRAWYLNHFHKGDDYKAVGEKSPSYLMYADPENIYDFNSDIKLITILRNPVERAYSHYCMYLKADKIGNNPNKEIKEGHRFVDEGFYFKHLRKYLEVFDRSQLRILFYDDLKSDPVNFLNDVYDFLEVKSDFNPGILKRKYHSRGRRPKYQGFYNSLVAIAKQLNKSKVGAWLTSKFRQSYGKQLFWKIFGSNKEFPTLSQEKVQELKNIYSGDIEQLETLTNRDLKHWK